MRSPMGGQILGEVNYGGLGSAVGRRLEKGWVALDVIIKSRIW